MAFVLVCFVALVGASLVSSECGRKPAGARIINGQNAQPHSWPWQISLRQGRRFHLCGGALISDRWVVTASHCIHDDLNPGSYMVVVGAHRMSGSTSVEKTIRVSQVLEHPRYDSQRDVNDIALIGLATPVEFDSAGKVGTVCLTDQRPAPGKRCYITGWGAINGHTQQSPDILQQGVMPIASHENCRRKYGDVSSTAHLCAGEARSDAAGGCNGDSGGPLVCEDNGRWFLHGAVSYGLEYCPTTHYTVFARVASYTDWIKRMTGVGLSGEGGGVNPPPPPPPTGNPPPPPTDYPPPPPPPPTDCEDEADNCASLAQYCSTESIRNKWCRKTCNPCSGGGGDGGTDCRDTGEYCDYHVPRGDCERMDIVRRKCKKSCGLC